MAFEACKRPKKAEDTATKFFLLTSFFLMDVCSIKCLGTKYCNLDPDFSYFSERLHSIVRVIVSFRDPTIRSRFIIGSLQPLETIY